MVEDSEELDYALSKKTVTPTISYLFTVNDNTLKLDKEIKKYFTLTLQNFFFIYKKERPDIQITVMFLITRVIEPDKNN